MSVHVLFFSRATISLSIAALPTLQISLLDENKQALQQSLCPLLLSTLQILLLDEISLSISALPFADFIA